MKNGNRNHNYVFSKKVKLVMLVIQQTYSGMYLYNRNLFLLFPMPISEGRNTSVYTNIRNSALIPNIVNFYIKVSEINSLLLHPTICPYMYIAEYFFSISLELFSDL
jgi:hypothetical protein